MNPELTELIVPAIGGIVLGGIFFGGLYWTVASVQRFRRKGLVLVSSAIVRLVVVIGAGLILLGAGSWERMLATLLGIVVTRQILLITVGRKIKTKEVDFHEAG